VTADLGVIVVVILCEFCSVIKHHELYCRASFEIMTRIRPMAPLLYIINFSKLRLRVKNETTFISAKNRVDLSSISEVCSYIAEWPRFFWPTLYIYVHTHILQLHTYKKFVTRTML